MNTDRKQLGRQYASWLQMLAQRLRLRLKPLLADNTVRLITDTPGESSTFGWATYVAKLQGLHTRRFELWLDHYANIGRPTLCLCFRSTKPAEVRAASSLDHPVTTLGIRDVARPTRGNYLLKKPLPRSTLERPIAEYYPGENYLSVYFLGPTRPRTPPTKYFEDKVASRLMQLIRAAASVRTDEQPGRRASNFPDTENRRKVRMHLTRERSERLARAAKERDGYVCQVCGFHFAERYGDIGRGYAEAHHKVWLSSLTKQKKNRPQDLVTVCANCHRMLHLMDGRPSDVGKLRKMYQSHRTRMTNLQRS
jgi:5-methylcytosine-specific restriction endonuclease McrA